MLENMLENISRFWLVFAAPYYKNLIFFHPWKADDYPTYSYPFSLFIFLFSQFQFSLVESKNIQVVKLETPIFS